jgi:hypothetical protein
LSTLSPRSSAERPPSQITAADTTHTHTPITDQVERFYKRAILDAVTRRMTISTPGVNYDPTRALNKVRFFVYPNPNPSFASY